MKDLSFLLLKNSLASKMKKGLRNFCHGVGSTSTLNQQTADRDTSCLVTPSSLINSYIEDSSLEGSPPTLEEMILKLDLEEAAMRKARLDDDPGESRRRMSCVNNSDILRSARNALNQYPRFSLDGRDSLYRSSFRSFAPRMAAYASGWKSACCEPHLERGHGLPSTLGGESVVWCKPGVVPKLMGLEAVPVPISSRHCNGRSMSSKIRQQKQRRIERNDETQKRILVMGMHGCGGTRRQTMGMGEPSNVNYCTAKPIRRLR
ncbi:hypothetical protein MRB53_017973 [Persea americana]|uniref:Uncharacterized protein n=1 Tax=Persea americana TaxID=3435 RepID=A0ACC2M7I2_PERAE|nr:hypothetical protein MRB53_017973 [Persea americana]